jgi:hypothetical protein
MMWMCIENWTEQSSMRQAAVKSGGKMVAAAKSN